MKNPTLLFLLLLSSICYGQKDSLKIDELLKVIASRNKAEKSVYNDTVKVLLLVCDTTKYPSEFQGWYEIDPQVFWKPGFVVIEKYSYDPAPLIFLDRRKKVLEKKLVVWLLKEIE